MARASGIETIFSSRTANAVFSYATILLVQLKVVWGLWHCRDLATGDTTSYFTMAKLWHANMMESISWSPLYIVFLGGLLDFSEDAYAVTIAHRLIIIFVLAILVLAVMRCLLSPAIAWLMAAWWVVLPINFNALYEVHLFALIPILIAYLVISSFPTSVGRGWGVSLLLLSAVLMRNELIIPTVLFGLACLVYEFRNRSGTGATFVRRILKFYGVPLILTIGLCGFFYWRAIDKWPILRAMMERKHSLNICQVYASGYQQRHPEWTLSPWTDCQQLMTSTFGKPEPSLTEALARNPQAMMQHFLWNASLIPNGVQVLIFNCMSGKVNPDYAGVISNSTLASVLSLALFAIFATSLFLIRGRWREFFGGKIAPRIWTWLAMLCVSSVLAFVMVSQRPRPSYMFSLTILILALTGICVQTIVDRLRFARSWSLLPIVAIAMILVVPGFYTGNKCTPRVFLSYYRDLQPFSARLGPGTVIATPGYGSELCNYFEIPQKQPCNGLFYYDLRRRVTPSVTLNDVLTSNKVQYLLVDEQMLHDQPVADFLGSNQAQSWNTIGRGDEQEARWLLLEKKGGG